MLIPVPFFPVFYISLLFGFNEEEKVAILPPNFSVLILWGRSLTRVNLFCWLYSPVLSISPISTDVAAPKWHLLHPMVGEAVVEVSSGSSLGVSLCSMWEVYSDLCQLNTWCKMRSRERNRILAVQLPQNLPFSPDLIFPCFVSPFPTPPVSPSRLICFSEQWKTWWSWQDGAGVKVVLTGSQSQ